MSPIFDQSRADLFQSVLSSRTRAVGHISAAPLQDIATITPLRIAGADQLRARSNAKPIDALLMSAVGGYCCKSLFDVTNENF